MLVLLQLPASILIRLSSIILVILASSEGLMPYTSIVGTKGYILRQCLRAINLPLPLLRLLAYISLVKIIILTRKGSSRHLIRWSIVQKSLVLIGISRRVIAVYLRISQGIQRRSYRILRRVTISNSFSSTLILFVEIRLQ